jgi:HEAT repeat protein
MSKMVRRRTKLATDEGSDNLLPKNFDSGENVRFAMNVGVQKESTIMRFWFVMIIMLSATLVLGQSKPDETVQKCRTILSDAANDHNPDVRKGAAEALSLVGVKDVAVELLPPLLDDHDVTVRVAAVNTLGDLKENKTFVIPLLKKALADPVPEVDFSAAKVLYQLHDPEGAEFLLEVVNKESKASSSYVTKEKRTALRMLHTPQKLFMTLAISAAGFAPVPGLGFGLSSAQGILSDPDSSARAASLLLVGNSTDPGLADVVSAALLDKEWSVRAAAAHVVGVHPFPALRVSLPSLLADKKEAVQVRAAAAYIRLQNQPKESPARHHPATHPPPASAPAKPTHSA